MCVAKSHGKLLYLSPFNLPPPLVTAVVHKKIWWSLILLFGAYYLFSLPPASETKSERALVLVASVEKVEISRSPIK